MSEKFWNVRKNDETVEVSENFWIATKSDDTVEMSEKLKNVMMG